MKAYPYEVELRITNENTREQRLETRRVYAYNAMDAGYQALLEVTASAGSADVRIVRMAPPPEACRSASPLEELTRAIGRTVAAAQPKGKR